VGQDKGERPWGVHRHQRRIGASVHKPQPLSLNPQAYTWTMLEE
jgi:hypothetical protein